MAFVRLRKKSIRETGVFCLNFEQENCIQKNHYALSLIMTFYSHLGVAFDIFNFQVTSQQ